MIGYGLNIAGTPKDYTSIVAARQRQKQLGELEEKKKKQAMNEDILKSISVPTGLVMDYRMKEMEQATADFVREVSKARDEEDINKEAQLKQRYKMLWDQRVAERKVFDDDIKNYEAGKTVLAADPRLLMQAKTPEEALKLAQEYPDSFYSSDFGNITLRPTGTLNFQDIYLKNQKESDGKWDRQGNKDIWIADPDDYNNRNSATFDSRLDVRNNAKAIYINRYGYQTLNALSPQDQYDELKRFFIENGKPFLPGQKMKFEPRSNVTNISVGGGDQGTNFGDWTQQPLEFLFTNMSGQSTQGKYEDSYGMSLQKFDVSMPATTGYRNLNGGAKIPFTVGDDIKFSGAYVAPVVKKGAVTNKGQREGEIILPYDLDEQAKKGNVVYELIATGQGKIMPAEDGKPMYDEKNQVLSEQVKVYRPFNEAMGAFEQGLSEPEKKDWKNNKYPAAMKLVKEKNEELRRLYGGGKPAPKAGGTAPAKLPTKKPNKYGI